VDAGPLERRRYQNRPPRYEYVLTMTGRSLRPVILALHAWGNKDLAPDPDLAADRRFGATAARDPDNDRIFQQSENEVRAGPNQLSMIAAESLPNVIIGHLDLRWGTVAVGRARSRRG
jgi:HxlR-like helix-turn-helix